MKNIYRITFCLILIAVALLNAGKTLAGIGDTTIVQTLRFDSSMRAGVFMFPADTSKTYQKITMLYSMRCKNGLISTGTSTNLGCGEWDYNCYTYVVDSSQTDSLRSTTGSSIISNYSDTVFNYTTLPAWTYTLYNQQSITYTSTISEDTASIGAGTTALTAPFNTTANVSRTQYLWTATELTAAGLTAGDITGIKLDIFTAGSTADNLRIRLKHTTETSVDENNPDVNGFSEAYFLNTPVTSTGMMTFNFPTPFTWDGTSNLIVDFSFSLTTGGVNSEVNGEDAGFNATLISSQDDGYLSGNSSLSGIRLNSGFYPSITDQITITFWVNGDSARLPDNTSFIEAVDNNNQRQVNIHLPWSDSNIYWDCGNDGTGYDRISKAATSAEIKGQWNFWAFTKNATTGVMIIYLNGALWHSGSGKTKMIDIQRMVAAMGAGGSNFYPGSYDELSLWNKELSQASIQQIMYKDITASHPDYSSLQVYYNFNAPGNIAVDASPNGYNSEIINPTYRTHRGHNLFRNFSVSTFRPNITFVNGVYTSTTQNFPIVDSVINVATSVISYSVLNNDLQVIDTIYVYPAGYSYMYDPSGVLLDSIALTPQATLNISQLTYYQKRPMRIELINFITPYGINLNLDGLNGKTWEFDVTDYAPLLKGARFLAMEDGNHQEDNDIKFVFYEGTPARDVKFISQIWPSGTWVAPSYNDIVSNRFFEPRTFNLSAAASQFKIRSAINGHFEP